MTRVFLYRRSLGLKSGAAQLMSWQASALEAAGASVRIGGSHGRLKFWLRTGRYPRRVSLDRVRAMGRDRREIVVDHDVAVPEADIVYVHNLVAGLAEHLPVPADVAEAEAGFFAGMKAGMRIVANSGLVAAALTRLHAVPSHRIVVQHPGIDTERFSLAVRERFRERERARLGCGSSTPLIGLVTSGYFEKRGIDVFLAAAGIIHRHRPDARFLVVGSKQLPAAAYSHPLMVAGHMTYRPKDTAPARHFAPLDVLLYPAVFEEFGMVVAEALAMGVPVVVSGRVGAAEILPAGYLSWGLTDHAAESFAGKCLELISDDVLASGLASEGAASAAGLAADRYASTAAEFILMRDGQAG